MLDELAVLLRSRLQLRLRSHRHIAGAVGVELLHHRAPHEQQGVLPLSKRRSRHKRHLVQDRVSPLLV